MQEFIRNGTTTLEAKSGYGLDLDSEVKLLESISEINRSTDIDIKATWLGAHDFPPEMGREDYVEHLISDQLPVISELSLAIWVYVFCEQGCFTNEQTEDIVKASKNYGMKSRLHVDEFVDSGGLLWPPNLDRLALITLHVRTMILESVQQNPEQCKHFFLVLLCPGKAGVTDKKCISEDWPFSIATDFNPNCPITSLPLIGSLVTHRLGVDP